MRGLKIDILWCSEVPWLNSGKSTIDRSVFYYSGDNTPQNRNVVPIVKGFIRVKDRIASLKLNARPCNINIIVASANDGTKKIKSIFILGDFRNVIVEKRLGKASPVMQK